MVRLQIILLTSIWNGCQVYKVLRAWIKFTTNPLQTISQETVTHVHKIPVSSHKIYTEMQRKEIHLSHNVFTYSTATRW